VVAAQKAKFGQPEVKLGFFPPYAAIRLPALVGPAKAIEICATGRTYSADEAVAMGFVTRAVENEQFDAEIAKLVGEIQTSSPLILRLNKQAVKAHLGMNFATAINSVSDLFLNTLMKTEDTLEGIASFYEKRKSVWKNK
jgi:cyclohexa-1,5-dienecarbonyl-CoA hydratase